MALVERTAVARAVSTAAPTASSTKKSTHTKTDAPTVVFQTPSLTTAFKPPPECTSQHLTMLESDAFKIWMNEPEPVPDKTFASCYPDAFMTSYLQQKSSTIAPAFSPLVCPENYHTVFNQTITNRPLYVACCPSNFLLAPPSTSTPGRPAYGGTCYSDLSSTTVTKYDNSSSFGVIPFPVTAVGEQAYAHPIDGYALDDDDVILASGPDTASYTGGIPTIIASATPSASTPPESTHTGLPPGAIAGIAVGGVVLLALVGAIFFWCGRRRSPKAPARDHDPRIWQPEYKSPLHGASSRAEYPPEKILPPEPAYGRYGRGTKAHEVGVATPSIQELPGTHPHPHPHPQELAALSAPLVPDILTSAARGYSYRSSTTTTESGFPHQHPSRSRTSLSDHGHWPKPPATPRNDSQLSNLNPFRSPPQPSTPSEDTTFSPLSPRLEGNSTGEPLSPGRSGNQTMSPLSPGSEKERRKKHKRNMSYGW